MQPGLAVLRNSVPTPQQLIAAYISPLKSIPR